MTKMPFCLFLVFPRTYYVNSLRGFIITIPEFTAAEFIKAAINFGVIHKSRDCDFVTELSLCTSSILFSLVSKSGDPHLLRLSFKSRSIVWMYILVLHRRRVTTNSFLPVYNRVQRRLLKCIFVPFVYRGTSY